MNCTLLRQDLIIETFCCRDPVATILPTVTVEKFTPAPSVAYFSSRGPSSITRSILKVNSTCGLPREWSEHLLTSLYTAWHYSTRSGDTRCVDREGHKYFTGRQAAFSVQRHLRNLHGGSSCHSCCISDQITPSHMESIRHQISNYDNRLKSLSICIDCDYGITVILIIYCLQRLKRTMTKAL